MVPPKPPPHFHWSTSHEKLHVSNSNGNSAYSRALQNTTKYLQQAKLLLAEKIVYEYTGPGLLDQQCRTRETADRGDETKTKSKQSKHGSIV